MREDAGPPSEPTVQFVASHVSPTLGIEHSLLEVATALSKRTEVEVVCIGGSSDDARLFPRTVCLGGPLRGARRLFSLPRLFSFARRAPSGAILVAVGIWSAVPLLLVSSKRSAARTIVWEHSLIEEKVRSAPGLKLLELVARAVYGRAHSVVCVSEESAAYVRRVCRRSDVRVIPNAVTVPDTIRDGRPHEVHAGVPRLVTVGSLQPWKNQRLIIEALARAQVQVELVVVGDGPERPHLEAVVDALGLRDRVRFRGHCPREVVLREIAASELMVHASVGETFGVVFAEAALLGTGVVAVRNAASEALIPEWVDGVICESSAAGLAAAIDGELTRRRSDGPERRNARRIEDLVGAEAVTSEWERHLETADAGRRTT
jgi:glycosyltransferase involved in cell wall biosynthesis